MKKNTISEIFNRFIRGVNDLSVIDNTFFSMDDFKRTISLIAKDVMQFADDYEKKQIHSAYENNESLDFFHSKITENEQATLKEQAILKKNLEDELKNITEELGAIRKANIQSFKDYEQDFINKQRFLNENKKNNKDEYMNNVFVINQERIFAKHNYDETANDLDNKNEQTGYEYNHIRERYTQNYDENLSIVNQNYEQKVRDLESQYAIKIDEIEQQISILKRMIVDNTIELNDSITALEKDSKRKQRYGFVPFDLETTQLNDEHEDKIHAYSEIEENILSEFKSQLQKIDNEIQQLRKEQRGFENQNKLKLDSIKIEINLATNKQLSQFDHKYSQLKNQYRKKKNSLVAKELNQLKKARTNYEKGQKKLLLEKQREIKEQLLQKELEYIEKFETLRIQKNKCEAIKSNAMKNLNSEKDYYNSSLNAKLQNILDNKETFVEIEQCEENKQVLDLRLNRDLENANTNFEINEHERNIKQLDYELTIKKERAEVHKQSQINLLDINLDYQNMVLENRGNFANISTMLEIQKNSLVKDYITEISYRKMDHELTKYNFYNECDNIQYKIYKIQHELSSKILDAEMETATKIADVKRQHALNNNKHEEKSIVNFSLYRECMERVNFYKERFEIEKKMFEDATTLFTESFKSITELESYYIKLLATIPSTYFEKNKHTFAYLLDLLREMKIFVITNLFSNQTNIINSRIDFDKGLKYSRISNALTEEKESSLLQLENKITKITETMNGYHTTISRFKTNIEELKKDIHNKYESIVKHYLHNHNETSFNIKNINESIKENKDKINALTNQINTIKINIRELKITEHNAENEILKTKKRYEKRFNAIAKAQLDDTKIYDKTRTKINNQFLKTKLICNTYAKYLSTTAFTFASVPYLINRIISTNNTVLLMAQEQTYNNTASFSNAVSKELTSLTENYVKSYERNDNQVYSAKINDDNTFKNKYSNINHLHEINLENLKKKFDKDLQEVLKELVDVNDIQLGVQKTFDNYMLNFLDKHENDLNCQKENLKMYDKDYHTQNNKIREIYHKKIKDNKILLNKSLKQINQNSDNYQKHNQSRHSSNIILRKNTIHEFKNEYLVNRNKYNLRIKEIHKLSHKKQSEFDSFMKKSQEEYSNIQKNSRHEFKTQLKQIDRKAIKRIRENQRKYKKSFWNQ